MTYTFPTIHLPFSSVRIADVDEHVTGLPCGPHGRGLPVRRSAVVRVTAERFVGSRSSSSESLFALGEAAPLEGYSPDTFDEARTFLVALSMRSLPVAGGNIVDILGSLEPDLSAAPPSARFAVESAVALLACQRGETAGAGQRISLWQLFRDEAPARLPLAWVVAGDDDLYAIPSGAAPTTLKVKIGRRRWTEVRALLHRIRERFPYANLRLDANRRVALSRECLAELAAFSPEWVEELQVKGESSSTRGAAGGERLAVAVDESLRGHGASKDAATFPYAKADFAVLKPTVLGLLPAIRLAISARASGIVPVVSHTLEPGPARAFLREVAFSLMDEGVAAGLGPYPEEPCGEPWLLRGGDGEVNHPVQGFDVRDAAMLSVFAAAEEAPATPAFLGEIDWTYEMLAREVRRGVTSLVATLVLGAPRKAAIRVAFVARRSPGTLVLLHSLLEAGLCAVPLHARWTDEECERALEQVAVDLLIPDPDSWWRALPERCASSRPTPVATPDDVCAVLFTSGSSGSPKAAVLSRRAVLAAARAGAAHLRLGKGDRWLLSLSLAHAGGFSVLIRALVTRTTVAVLPESPFDPGAWWSFAHRECATGASLVPTMVTQLLGELSAASTGAPVSTLRTVLVGGARLSPAVAREARARGLPVRQSYGMTETFGQVATEVLESPPLQGRSAERGSDHAVGTATGVPLPGVALRIRDGILWLRCPFLFDGFLAPDGTLTRPFEEGWYRTNDIAEFHGGQLRVLGRGDALMITGGENVDPTEVEEALRRTPQVRDLCVYSVPDEAFGERIVVAVVGDVRERALDASAQKLAPFKRPRAYIFLDALPLLPSGKVDRTSLRAMHPPAKVPGTH